MPPRRAYRGRCQVACSTMTNSKDEGEVDSAEFARILTKQAVAHVCVAIGFTATSAGALDCLTDVVQRYVETMAKRTMENTYRAGRTEPNIPDVLQGFQQMRTPLSWTELRDFAFSEDGYSNRYENAASSGSGSAAPAANGSGGARAAGGGRQELPKRWDQPFHHAVPPFPMPRKRAAPWDDAEDGEEGATEGPRSRPPHIPAFMPPLPPSTSRGASAGSDRSLAEVDPTGEIKAAASRRDGSKKSRGSRGCCWSSGRGKYLRRLRRRRRAVSIRLFRARGRSFQREIWGHQQNYYQ
ncbi:unnamed protein product, partial [Ectocarpus sp. 13 AM-2016]